jgi:succinyl-diaminopimelate desuccinylase
MDFTEAFLRVEQERDYIIDLLRKIICVDTTIPPGENYGELVDILEAELKRFGFETRRVAVPEEKYRLIPEPLSGERINLVGVLKNGRPRSTFYAHMDVVPVDDHWSEDPFVGTVKDGKLYGRGAVDMKGAIACFMGAVKVIHEMGLEPHSQMECCFCTDEEVGVYPGSLHLAKKGYFSNHLVWGELGTIEPAVLTGIAGAARANITAIGKSCHSGMNWMGVNAIEELIPVMQALMGLKSEVEKKESRLQALPLPGAPSERMTPMFNLNVIHGGVKENVVAGECRLTVNRRYLPDERYEEVISEIDTAVRRGLKNSRLLDLKMDFHNIFSPVEIDTETDASKKMRSAATAVWGYHDFLFGGISASTDMGMVLEELQPEKPQIACCGLVRVGNNLAHAADEHVLVEDLISVTKQLVHYYAF